MSSEMENAVTARIFLDAILARFCADINLAARRAVQPSQGFDFFLSFGQRRQVLISINGFGARRCFLAE